MRFPAIAPRVAKTTQRAVAANTSPRITRPTALITCAIDESRCSHLAMVVETGCRHLLAEPARQGGKVGIFGNANGDEPWDRQLRHVEIAAEPWLEEGGRRLLVEDGRHRNSRHLHGNLGGASDGRVHVDALARLHLDGHLVGDLPLPALRPVDDDRHTATARHERNAMIATRVSSARRATVRGGTIGLALRGAEGRPAVWPIWPTRAVAGILAAAGRRRPLRTRVVRSGLAGGGPGGFDTGSVIDFDVPGSQHQAAGVILVHQREVVRRDNHRGTEPVQLDEKAEQATGERRVDVARRLVGKEDFRLGDERAGDRGALLLSAGEHLRKDPHLLPEAHPFEELHHVAAVGQSSTPATRSGNATFSNVVKCSSSLKSWNTIPIRRRSAGTTLRGTVAASLLKIRTLPRVGRSERKSRRSSDVLPAPDGPVTNWNEPGAM